jgi:hypothetical protein
MTEVRTRTRPVAQAAQEVRQRSRPVIRQRSRPVPAKPYAEFFENVLPGVYVHCGLCRGEDAEGVLMGRIVYKHMERPARVFPYKGTGHPNDPASYEAVDVTKNYEDALALLQRKHKCTGTKAKEKPAAVRQRSKPGWATGQDLSKVRARTRKA